MRQYASIRTKMLEAFRRRMYFFMAMVLIVFTMFLAQLFYLQVVKYEEYSLRSRSNMESNIPIPASRGEIYDRNFSLTEDNPVIASNRSSFNITTIPANFEDDALLEQTIKKLSRLLQFDYQSIIDQIKNSNPWDRFVIKEDVKFDKIVKIASYENLFPNIDWGDAPVRVYKHDNMFAHSIGYIGSITKDEYGNLKNAGYKHYQKIGKTGIEKEYDMLLRGVDGYVRRIVDVKNRMEGEEIGQHPVSGNNLVLTIDYEVQKTAYEAMAHNKGSVVVIKPATGEILCLLSKPDYDPNQIISRDNATILEELYKDKDKPFLNRAIQSRYPPASTFKLVTTISALEEEKWNPQRVIYCPGKYTLQGYIDKDFYCYSVHGSLDMIHAIGKSCSVYFYQLGYSIGPTIILKYANYFGLNNKTGIDIPGEIDGFIPSKKWKLKTFGQPWFDGDTLNLSIGQGFLAVTNIGMANLVSAIVNKGVLYKPHLVKTIRSNNNQGIISSHTPEKLKEVPLSQTTLNVVTQGMRIAVKNGTAARLGYIKVPICGKTGTAQTRSRRKDDASQHAWFVGFAPYDGKPEDSVVVVVMVEYGIAGAVSAVPVAEAVFNKLYRLGYF